MSVAGINRLSVKFHLEQKDIDNRITLILYTKDICFNNITGGHLMNMSSDSFSNLFFRKTKRMDTTEITLTSDMMRVMMAISEDKDMATVANEIGMEPSRMKPVVSELLFLGLIEQVVKNMRYLDISFYNYMKKNLMQSLGPIAEVVIEDVMADMSLSMESIPVHRAADLVNSVAEQIPDPEAQKKFKNSLLKIIPA